MKIQLLVTKTDFCLPNLQRELKGLDIDYEVAYIEDNTNLVVTHKIRHSPNIFVDGQLAFRYQPSEQELASYFNRTR